VNRASQISVQRSGVQRVALVCLLLVACFSFAESTHFHSIASPDGERHCNFCLLVHANSAAAPVSAGIAALDLLPTQILQAEDCKTTTLLRGSDLDIRPPPLV
jgi:hypothetical protein